jgi:TetR/AcrR family transcriptional regulator
MKNSRPAKKRRRPGRPRRTAPAEGRAALLSAARELFLRHGYRAVSARQIALRAGVDPALLVYHFKSKYGLYREVLNAALKPIIDKLESASHPPSVAGLVETYMGVLAENPWIAGLIVREVLADTGSYRQQFIQDFPVRMVPQVMAVAEQGIARGKLRPDLDPRYVVVTCMSLAILPSLAAPVMERALGLRMQGKDRDALIQHTTAVLMRGLGVEA